MIQSAAMRFALFFPLTFVAGVHGFAIFAPYLFFIAMLAALRKPKRVEAKVAPVILAPPSIPRPAYT